MLGQSRQTLTRLFNNVLGFQPSGERTAASGERWATRSADTDSGQPSGQPGANGAIPTPTTAQTLPRSRPPSRTVNGRRCLTNKGVVGAFLPGARAAAQWSVEAPSGVPTPLQAQRCSEQNQRSARALRRD